RLQYALLHSGRSHATTGTDGRLGLLQWHVQPKAGRRAATVGFVLRRRTAEEPVPCAIRALREEAGAHSRPGRAAVRGGRRGRPRYGRRRFGRRRIGWYGRQRKVLGVFGR